ncbi:EAL domain-containing protein [Variovorax sp. LT1R16]|uniref:EAL domain-containing protein n=1 Tax=Variovorax sp. LT1R16 TaxID=3443728 RepID=UPI003F44F2E0
MPSVSIPMHDAGRPARPTASRMFAAAWSRLRHAAPAPLFMACLALFLACVWGSAWLASRQGLQRAERRAAEFAAGVLGGVEAIGAQIDEAMARGSRGIGSPTHCDSADVPRLQAVQARYSYIGAIARVNPGGDRILCSTFGPEADGLLLGPADDVIRRGTRRVHRRVTMPTVDGAEYFVLSNANLAVFVHRSVATTILATLQDASLGAYVRDGGPMLFSRGSYDIGVLKALEHSGASAAFDGHRLLGLSASPNSEYVAFIDLPAARVKANIDDARASLLPLGAVLGLALSLLLFVSYRSFSSVAASLARALHTDRVFMEYQPIVDLRTGRCIGAEALVRWRHGGGLVPPQRFIVAAERAGIMPLVTRRIVQLVALDMAELLRTHPALHVSINFSAMDLRSTEAVELLTGLLRVTGLPAASFWIEITETSFEENVSQIIDRIRALGFRVAIDDFGTGYANLGTLASIEVDLLKIDRRFVQSATQAGQASEVAIAIIGLARSLELEMVAEGVETQAQADFLIGSGVQFAQGWLFGRPASVDALRAFIAQQNGGASAQRGPGTPEPHGAMAGRRHGVPPLQPRPVFDHEAG